MRPSPPEPTVYLEVSFLDIALLELTHELFQIKSIIFIHYYSRFMPTVTPKTLSPSLSLTSPNSPQKSKLSRAVVAHTFNPSTWEAEAGRFLSRGQPGLQSKFQDSQGYTEKSCLEKQKQTNSNNKTNKQNRHF